MRQPYSKNSQNFMQFYVLCLLLLVELSCFASRADIQVVTQRDFEMLMGTIEDHELRWLHWPTEEEISHYIYVVSSSLRDECVNYLKNMLNPDASLDVLKHNLIAMKSWGAPTKEYREKGGADVFIGHFRLNEYVLQFIDSPYSVVLIAAKENNEQGEVDKPATIADITMIASSVFSEALLYSDPSSIHVVKITEQVLKGAWHTQSSIVESRSDGVLTVRTGVISSISFITNGRVFIFEIIKPGLGSRADNDPYVNRFNPPKEISTEEIHDASQAILDIAIKNGDRDVIVQMAEQRIYGDIADRALANLAEDSTGQLILILMLASGINHSAWNALFKAADSSKLDPSAVEKLIESLADMNLGGVRIEIARILGKTKDQKACLPLIEAFRTEENAETREAIVSALSSIKDNRALPMLREAMKNDPSSQVRLYAESAICNIEGTDFESVRSDRKTR